METFEGKGAVITGGASGIGFATAKQLGAKGAHVVIADVDAAALETAVGALRDGGITADGVLCDVRSLESVQALADESFRRVGAVHVVFNNAGIAVGGPVAAMTHQDWRWVIDVDLWGPIHGVEAFLPRMIEQHEGGHVLFTASFAGLVPNVGLGPYCVAKYGVVALAEVLSRELREHSIGVSVLCPMRVATNIGNSERNRAEEYGGPEAASNVLPQGEDNTDLAGRVLDVDDVAALTIDAVVHNRLYVLPHEESRTAIKRRFERIDRTFEEQAATR
jgi:NAD(P)-dependent dehydrogenase (short-subunit alcohol dehydrogenase family)